jgi:type IV fimbrial biogenesis protein FimT
MEAVGMSQKGFTLIELMITLALLGILMGLAVPNFAQMLRDNRAASELNVFVSMFNFARGEAAGRGQATRVEGPLAGDGSWRVVRVRDDEVLRVFPSLSAFQLDPNVPQNIVFDAQGRVAAAVGFAVKVISTDFNCAKYNRRVSVNRAGVVALGPEGC